MDSNRIQRIEPSTFYGLNKLKYLGLSKNYLKTLDKVSVFKASGRSRVNTFLVIGLVGITNWKRGIKRRAVRRLRV